MFCRNITNNICDYNTIKLEITNENKQANKQNKLVLPPGNKKIFLLNNSWLQGKHRLKLQNL